MRPLSDCLLFEPPYELDFGTVAAGVDRTRSLTLANECDVGVSIGEVRLRDPGAAFEPPPPDSTILEPTERRVLEFRFTGGSTGLVEEVAIIEIASPVVGRRPITLRALVSTE
jgi:hypothetical protein